MRTTTTMIATRTKIPAARLREYERRLDGHPYLVTPPRWPQPANWPKVPTLGQHLRRLLVDPGYYLDMTIRFLLHRPAASVQWMMMYHIANTQHRDVLLEAARGWTKSTITVIYASYLFWCDPNHQLICVHKIEPEAKKFASALRRLFLVLPWLGHLNPKLLGYPHFLNRTDSFNVGARWEFADQNPSVFAVGIGGTATGHRADTVIFDDIETRKNARTETRRDDLVENVAEYDYICRENARRIFLGTPQTRFTVYNRLPGIEIDADYRPVQEITPTEHLEQLKCSRMLVPGLDSNDQSTFPEIKSTEQLHKERGRDKNRPNPTFRLQVMLDTSDVDLDQMPLATSKFARRVFETSPDFIACIDPNRGRGGDEMAIAVGTVLLPFQGIIADLDAETHGRHIMYVRHIEGLNDTFGRQLSAVLRVLQAFRIRTVYVESNLVQKADYQSQFPTRLSEAALDAGIDTRVESIWSTGNKLDRILDTMQPPLETGEIAVHPDVFSDPRTAEQFSMFRPDELPPEHIGDDRADACSMLIQKLLPRYRRLTKVGQPHRGQGGLVAGMSSRRRRGGS
jgi:hypothetical protein